jgi:TM2 domain-containing membrane protein YozV
MLCQKCGADIKDDADFCNSCGAVVQKKSTSPVQTEIRNPWTALILSFFFVGWGQWYNGRTREGLLLLGGSWILFILMYVAKFANISFLSGMTDAFLLLGFGLIYVYGMHNAYKTAEKINNGEESFSGKSKLFWLPFALVILFILYILSIFIIGAEIGALMSHDYGSVLMGWSSDQSQAQSNLRQQIIGNVSIDPIVGMWITSSGTQSEGNSLTIYKFYSDGTGQWLKPQSDQTAEACIGTWKRTADLSYNFHCPEGDLSSSFEYSPSQDIILENNESGLTYLRYTERNIPLSSEKSALQGSEFVYLSGYNAFDVPSFRVPENQTCTFTMKYTGQGDFIIQIRDALWNFVDNLVIAHGSYTGTQSEQLASGNYSLDVEASGPWSVQILC